MRICLYLEFYNFLNGILYRRIGTGLLTSYENQKAILNDLGIRYAEKMENDTDILQINTPWLKSLYLIKKAKRKGIKVIIWSHVTAEDFIGVFRFSNILSPFIKIYLKYAYNQADLIFCPTDYTKRILQKYGISTEKILVRSNGVNLSVFQKNNKLRDEYRIKYGLNRIAIGSVGLVIPRKGVDTFISLAGKLPRNDFIWFGKIYNTLLAESLPERLPDNCNFTGYCENIVAAYNSLDIFIFPSFEENEGMAILEAAAIGLPIIVRDLPVYSDWLINGKNCLKAKNDADFISAIERILNDKNLRIAISHGAQELARKKSHENIAKKTLEVYKSLKK